MKQSRLPQVTQPWYHEGLHFECTGCGKCCTGSPGYVWVTEEEICSIASHLQINVEDFQKRYVRFVNGRLSLKELLPSYDCVFLKDNQCQIYSVRPTQCRTFPFWPRLIRSKEAWLEAAKTCEGIRDDACLVSQAEIEDKIIRSKILNRL